MPITFKKEPGQETEQQESEHEVITSFIWKNNWFVMSQTSGAPVQMPEIPAWQKLRALESLNISEIPFAIRTATRRGTRESGRLQSLRCLRYHTKHFSMN